MAEASKGAIANVDMDSLLEGTLDQLADLPEFKPFPPGVHRCTIKWEREEKTIKMHVTALETVELAAPSKDTPLEKGTETTMNYKLDNEYGQGNFKVIMAGLTAIHGAASPSKLMQTSEGNEYNLVTDTRPNKDKTAVYTDVKAILPV
jgi:hypothetical protein